MTNTNTILLLESGDLEVYEGRKPSDGSMFYKRHSEGLNWGDYLLNKWLSTKRTVKMAQGEYKKLMTYFVKTMTVTDYYPIDVSDIVEIRDGLGYFKEPVREGESQEDIIMAVIELYLEARRSHDPMDSWKDTLNNCIQEIKSNFKINRK